MPTTLPVPSKSALRTLRHLALGTSFTVAFSTGVLTEDRRRRIKAAREVHDNAQKLKSSKNYHGGSTAALEALSARNGPYFEEDFWLPSQVLKHDLSGALNHKKLVKEEHVKPQDTKSTQLELPPPLNLPLPGLACLIEKIPPVPPLRSKRRPIQLNWQVLLAGDITSALDEVVTDLEACSKRFLEAFEANLPVGQSGLEQPLIQAATRLARTAIQQGNYRISEEVFDAVRSHGTMCESDFLRFKPYAMIQRLLCRPDGADPKEKLDPDRLRKAYEIYSTKFKDKPLAISERSKSVGTLLCKEACRLEMWTLIVDLYKFISSRLGDSPPVAVDYFMKATYKMGRYKNIFHQFHTLYTKTSPDQGNFLETGRIVIDSVLKIGKAGQAEKFLVSATKMAEEYGLFTPTTWFLRFFGEDWRAHRDVTRMTALFERLVPLLSFTSHPKALYSAAIQYYTEAGEDILAGTLYETMHSSYRLEPEDVRTLGHLALSRAMHNDWDEVRGYFRAMHKLNPTALESFSRSFVPILKLFAKSHTVEETERFIFSFMDQFGLQLNNYIVNHMAHVYAKAGEIDSIVSWVKFVLGAGVEPDPEFFNSILNQAHDTWNLSFWKLFDLYRLIREIPRAEGFFSVDTLSILRRIATAGSPTPEEASERLQLLRMFGKPCQAKDSLSTFVAMQSTYALQNTQATLKIYQQSQQKLLSVDAIHLVVAVRALLKEETPDVSRILQMIEDSHRKGWDVGLAITALYSHQISELFRNGGTGRAQITNLAQSALSTFERLKVSIPPEFITKTMSILRLRRRPHEAMQFWNSILDRPGLRTNSITISTLTIIASCSIDLQNSHALDKIMEMLIKYKLRPNWRFKKMLHNARRKTLDELEYRNATAKAADLLSAIYRALVIYKKLQAENQLEQIDVMSKTLMIFTDAAGAGQVEPHSFESGEGGQVENLAIQAPEESSCEMEVGHDLQDVWVPSHDEGEPGTEILTRLDPMGNEK